MAEAVPTARTPGVTALKPAEVSTCLVLAGNIFLAAACISYVGPFTGVYRDRLVQAWQQQCQQLGVPVSQPFSLQDTLASPMSIRDWTLQVISQGSHFLPRYLHSCLHACQNCLARVETERSEFHATLPGFLSCSDSVINLKTYLLCLLVYIARFLSR